MTDMMLQREAWISDELNDRAYRRCYGLIEYEDLGGGMIPGMYVVYAWSGPTLEEMTLGGGQVLFEDINKAIEFCQEMDYKEVIENMTSDSDNGNKRWTISYIPFG